MTHPGGRPTKYDPKFCEELIEHMKEGLSFESFAAKCDCCKDTLYEWANVHEEFSDAKKIGSEHCRIFWEKLGTMGASGGLNNFNATAWIFNMKNRFRSEWNDTQKVEQTSTVSIKNRDELIDLALKARSEQKKLSKPIADDE